MRSGQPNFSRGELAPQLHGRFDVDAYAAGLRRARNVQIMKYGGLTKRPGTRLVAEAIDGASAVRLLPFQFSLDQAYALEMGQGIMAPCALGGRVLDEELAVTNITNATAARVTAAYHGYAVDDMAYLTGIASGTLGDFLNGRFWRVLSVVNDNEFTIAANTVGLSTFTSCTGGITRVAAPPPPPTPPVVPPPVDPPEPPIVGGGGGGRFEYDGPIP